MARRWMGVALVAAGLAVGAPAQGQQFMPSPVGAARMPEPLPVPGSPVLCPPPQPNLVQGPPTPDMAPMGPPDCLSLPADHTSAFQCENFVDEDHWYFHPGMQWLGRQRLGAGEIAVESPDVHPVLHVVSRVVNVTADDINAVLSIPAIANRLSPLEVSAINRLVHVGDNVVNRLEADPNLPSPVQPGPHAPVLQQFNNLVPRMETGVRGTIGYMWQDQAIEYTGYYVFQDNKTINTFDANRVDVLFYNPPAGFGPRGPVVGDHGLWTDADRVSTTYGSTFWNNEVNYRRCNIGIDGIELLVGLRYVQEQDYLSIFAGHDDLRIASATYSVQTRNNIVAPQFGAEWTFPATKWVTFGLSGKGAWGANFLTSDVKLQRGDGLIGFDSTRAATSFAQIYDIGAFTDFHILERLRVRFGYNAIWLTGIAAAPDQVDFNLQGNQEALAKQILGTNSTLPTLIPNLAQRFVQIQALRQMELNAVRQQPHGRSNNNGSILFHGPMFELQFLF